MLDWMNHQLETIFGELGLAQYLDVFVEQGFDTWETILDITESDLDALGVKLGHRRKLQRRIANFRGIAPEASLAPPAQPSTEDTRLLEAHRPDVVPKLEPRETTSVVITKRKYRRHPKPDENAPERPPSAYVLFSNKMREDLKGRNLTFTEIAKLVGENWQNLSAAEKEPYESQAQAVKEKYQRDLADYKKTPHYKRYMQYLQEFKAKHTIQSSEKDSSKRIKLESNGTSGSSAATPTRSSRSGSAHSDGHEGPSSRQRISSIASVCESQRSASMTPNSYHASLDESARSPVMNHLDRRSSERSPTFTTSPRDLPTTLPGRRESAWSEDQQANEQRHLPSFSDVFDGSRFAHPNETTGFPFPRTHHNFDNPDSRPPTLKHDTSSAGSTSSSASSYGFPRTPLEGPLPIHALLHGGSKQPNHPFETSQLQPMYNQRGVAGSWGGEHSSKPSQALGHHNDGDTNGGVGIPPTNGYHSTSSTSQGPMDLQGQSTLNSGYAILAGGTQSVTPVATPLLPDGRKLQDGTGGGASSNSKLDGMSALLRAGEIVDRRAQ